jgi:hypothetical protein
MGEEVTKVPRTLGGGEGRRRRKRRGPEGWTTGLYGKGGRRWIEVGDRIYLLYCFSFFFVQYVRGTHTPKMCAQRKDEGGGFLML